MPRLCKLYPGICLTTEEKHGKKKLSHGRMASVPSQTPLPPFHTHTHTHTQARARLQNKNEVPISCRTYFYEGQRAPVRQLATSLSTTAQEHLPRRNFKPLQFLQSRIVRRSGAHSDKAEFTISRFSVEVQPTLRFQ